MALPIDYFAPETFAQANPFLSGFNAGQATINKGLINQGQQYMNQMNAAKAQYAMPEAQQQLLKDQLSNQILQPQAQYAPQMTLADLALKQAMPGYYGAMGQEALSKIPLNQAQANMANAQIPYLPYQMMGKYYQGLGQYMAHGPASLAVRMQNNPAFQNYVANNPQAQANYAGLMGSALGNQISVPGLPGMPPMKINASQNPNQNIQNGVPSAYGAVNPSDINSVNNAVQNSYIKSAFTPQQLQQITYENSADNMFNDVAHDFPAITKFAGLAGHAGMTASKYGSAFGLQTDPDYTKFIDFTQTKAPLISNEIRRAFGSQATDTQTEELNKLVNPVYWDKSPQIALSQLQSLYGALKANSRAITQPKNVNLAQAIGSINKSSPIPNFKTTLNKNSNRVRVKSPDGTVGTVSKDNLNDFLDNGYEEVQ